MPKAKKPQYQKMVLVPYDKPLATRVKDDDEIDFSKHTDTPYMAHIKLEMKKTLRNPGLGMRDKSRLYSQLLHKYQVAKENHRKDSRVKKRESQAPQDDKTGFDNVVNNQNDDMMWWDDDMFAESHQVEADSNHVNQPGPDGEAIFTDDDDYEADDVSMHSEPSLPVTSELATPSRNFRLNPTFRKRHHFEFSDDENEPGITSKHMRTIREGQRRNAIDSPPNPQVRLRQTIPHAGPLRKNIVQPEPYTSVEGRFKKRHHSEFVDDADENEAGASTKHLRMIRKGHRRRRNAVDSPPNAQVRLRQSIARAGAIRPNVVPSDNEIRNKASVIDRRFNKEARKRPASKLYSGKKGWLGRRIKYYTPPRQKQRKVNDSESDDGPRGKRKWSELPN